VVKHRQGGDPSSSRKSPGRTEYEPITLERGVTHDPEFENWANRVWNYGEGLGKEVSLRNFRKDLMIDVLNEAGGRECERCPHPASQTGERGLGTRSRG
jgi:phage tail-like protein